MRWPVIAVFYTLFAVIVCVFSSRISEVDCAGVAERSQALEAGAEEFCVDGHAIVVNNGSYGVNVTHSWSQSTNTHTVTLAGVSLSPYCDTNYRRCSIFMETLNGMLVVATPLVDSVGIVFYNYSGISPQYQEYYIAELPPSLKSLCHVTALFLISDVLRGFCLQMDSPDNGTIHHIQVHVDLADVSQSAVHLWDVKTEEIHSPTTLSQSILVRPKCSQLENTYQYVLSVDSGRLLSLDIEELEYKHYEIGICTRANDIRLVSEKILALYCADGITVIYDVCRNRVLHTFLESAEGIPYYSSCFDAVLNGDTLTIETTNQTVLLPSNATQYGSLLGCSEYFLSVLMNGQIFLTQIADNSSQLIGKNTFSEVRPQINHVHNYVIVNGDMETKILNVSCTASKLLMTVDQHFDLGMFFEGKTTNQCKCRPLKNETGMMNETDIADVNANKNEEPVVLIGSIVGGLCIVSILLIPVGIGACCVYARAAKKGKDDGTPTHKPPVEEEQHSMNSVHVATFQPDQPETANRSETAETELTTHADPSLDSNSNNATKSIVLETNLESTRSNGDGSSQDGDDTVTVTAMQASRDDDVNSQLIP